MAGAGSLHPAMRLSNRRREMARSLKDTAGFVARRACRKRVRHEAMRNAHWINEEQGLCQHAVAPASGLCVMKWLTR